MFLGCFSAVQCFFSAVLGRQYPRNHHSSLIIDSPPHFNSKSCSTSDTALVYTRSLLCVYRWLLFPRVLRDVSSVDLSVSVLGQRISMPVCVGATAMQRMAHPDGETATARGVCVRTHTYTHTHTAASSLLCILYVCNKAPSPSNQSGRDGDDAEFLGHLYHRGSEVISWRRPALDAGGVLLHIGFDYITVNITGLVNIYDLYIIRTAVHL